MGTEIIKTEKFEIEVLSKEETAKLVAQIGSDVGTIQHLSLIHI